ncbi:MAG: UDP-2,3-diacylglucosamine diphosphatase LpxI [Elusimicrobia bacterium]|nr:UDP-2,3-diacylglucosamine diphosphatase LpxI [Candidatus Obscuribacterium magneticum]
MSSLGLLAGNGRFPFVVAQEARRQGRRVVAIAFNEEADPALEQTVDRIYWVFVGQLNKWIDILRKEGVEEVVMAGSVRHSNMYHDLKKFHPDMRALKLYWRLRDRKADTILSSVAQEMAKDGLKLIPSITYLTHYLAPEGPLTKRKPSAAERSDIQFGFQLAKSMAGLDIGQTICVKNKAVIAVEGMEGTDRCIQRAGEMAKGNFTVIKVAKPKQDLRFDVPVIGLNTIETFQEAGGGVLVVEAGKTLILDREKLVDWANSEKIGVMGVTAP